MGRQAHGPGPLFSSMASQLQPAETGQDLLQRKTFRESVPKTTSSFPHPLPIPYTNRLHSHNTHPLRALPLATTLHFFFTLV